MTRDRAWVGALCMAMAASIWGGTFVASKVVLTVVPPWTLVAGRFAIVWLVLRVVLAIRRQATVPWRATWLTALIGVIGMPVSIGAQFLGTALTSASDGALVTSAAPAMMAVFAAILLKERLTALHGLAIAIATGGVVLVMGLGSVTWNLRGHGALAVAAVSWALYSVLSRWASRDYDPLAVLTGACGWGTLAALPFVRWDWPIAQVLTPTIGFGLLFIVVVSTLVAFALWSWGCARLPARIGGLFMFVQPLVGTVLASWLLQERPTLWFYAGGGLILLGVALAQAADQVLAVGKPADA